MSAPTDGEVLGALGVEEEDARAVESSVIQQVSQCSCERSSCGWLGPC